MVIDTKDIRYSSHRCFDAEHPALLLVVVAQFEILLVTDDTIIAHIKNVHINRNVGVS